MRHISSILIFLLLQQVLLAQSFDTCKISVQRIQGIDIVWTKYNCNNEICNGNKVSLWNNGQIRYQGSFKDGYPLGTFKEFNQSGNVVVWKYVDTLGITWHYDMNGKLKYSSTKPDEISGGGITSERIFYDNNGRKVKMISETSPPSSLISKTTYFDSLGKEEFVISTDFSFGHLLKPKHFKYLTSIYGVNYYEIILVKQSMIFLINRDFYKVPPENSSEIIQESIIYEFHVKNSSLFIYDKNKEKYIWLIKLNSA